MALALLLFAAMQTDAARGQTIGRYHLHRQIARGGMACIHIARSLGAGSFSRLVAAKRLDPHLANDSEFVEMFLDEARVASKIRHRNVVPVLDVVTIDGELIMVQELVHGVPLNKLFARAQQTNTRIPVSIAVAIAAQTLAGLHAAHEVRDETGVPLNIVHRDVSPQNIMIAIDGTARLLDFGVAKNAAAAHITRAGTFKGKLAYSAPEQLDGTISRQTDIYALGIVLWELLTGERLHAGSCDFEVFASVMQNKPRRLVHALEKRRAHGKIDDDTWAELTALDPIVEKALATELDTRYATAAEMEQALLAAIAPAPQADVAGWMSSLAQDLVDQMDHVIAAEEASWRKWQGTGPVQALATGSAPHLPRSSTSLPTEAAIPSARMHKGDTAPVATKRRRPPLIAFDSIALIVAAILFAGGLAHPDERVATTTPVEPPRVKHVTAKPVVAPPPPPLAPPSKPAPLVIETKPAKVTPTKPRPAIRRRARTVQQPDCSSPFYYEGTKKIFKPSCI